MIPSDEVDERGVYWQMTSFPVLLDVYGALKVV